MKEVMSVMLESAKEIERLRADKKEMKSRLESLEKDADRYRWLKNNGRYSGWRVEQEKNGWMTTHSASTLDAAIDTAMQKESTR